jgi:hypothetical protein
VMEWMPPPDGIECAKLVMFPTTRKGESIHEGDYHRRG